MVTEEVADNQQPDLKDIGWVAGLIDGEGSFGIYLRQGVKIPHFRAVVQISNTNKDALERVHSILEQLRLGHHIVWSKPRQNQHRPCWTVQIVGQLRLTRFLELFIPHLTIKKPQAVAMREWIAERLSRKIQSPISELELTLVNLIKMANSGRFNDYTLESGPDEHYRKCACGLVFVGKSDNQMYCSSACRSKAYKPA